MYALIEHEANFQDYKDLMPGILATGNIEEMASAMEQECNSMYTQNELTDIYDKTVERTDIKTRIIEHGLRHLQVDNDSNTVLSIVELPPKPKTRQYMVAQADTDDEGRNPSVSLFSDSDGNTNIYASAEEAREEIAKEIERIAQDEELDHSEVSFGNPQFEDDPEKDFYTNVLKRMPAEAGETASVNLPGGSTRTFTIIDFLA